MSSFKDTFAILQEIESRHDALLAAPRTLTTDAQLDGVRSTTVTAIRQHLPFLTDDRSIIAKLEAGCVKELSEIRGDKRESLPQIQARVHADVMHTSAPHPTLDDIDDGISDSLERILKKEDTSSHPSPALSGITHILSLEQTLGDDERHFTKALQDVLAPLLETAQLPSGWKLEGDEEEQHITSREILFRAFLLFCQRELAQTDREYLNIEAVTNLRKQFKLKRELVTRAFLFTVFLEHMMNNPVPRALVQKAADDLSHFRPARGRLLRRGLRRAKKKFESLQGTKGFVTVPELFDVARSAFKGEEHIPEGDYVRATGYELKSLYGLDVLPRDLYVTHSAQGALEEVSRELQEASNDKNVALRIGMTRQDIAALVGDKKLTPEILRAIVSKLVPRFVSSIQDRDFVLGFLIKDLQLALLALDAQERLDSFFASTAVESLGMKNYLKFLHSSDIVGSSSKEQATVPKQGAEVAEAPQSESSTGKTKDEREEKKKGDIWSFIWTILKEAILLRLFGPRRPKV